VGGRLNKFKDFWDLHIRDKWAVQIANQGYAIEFLSLPHLHSKPVRTFLPEEQHQCLWEEIDQMLEKRAITEIFDQSEGFYSTFFLVSNKQGGLRPILNLKPLNKFVKTVKFKMCTPQTIVQTLCKGDWLASLDLKDAYFHVPIRESHRKFLRFSFQERTFQFSVLPFGLSTAPRVFTKMLAPLVGLLHEQGIRLFPYIDDCLIVAKSPYQLIQAVSTTIHVLDQAGFVINQKKSHPQPVQRLQFLGVDWDSLLAMSFLPKDRAIVLRDTALAFMAPSATKSARQFKRLLGLIAASLQTVPFARLRMRPIQIFFNSQWSAETQSLEQPIAVPQTLVEHFHWWTELTNLTQGLKWIKAGPTRVLTTDACMRSWGAHLLSKRVQGRWTLSQQSLHINVLELQAVFNALKAFLPDVRGRSVLVQTDNTATLYYINKMGGTKSRELCALTWDLLLWCMLHQIDLVAAHIPGEENVLADRLSRHILPYHEWELAERVVQRIFQYWSTPDVDLFATVENRKLSRFCAIRYYPEVEMVNAMALTWTNKFLYAFPPLPMIRQVLMKVQREGAVMILIAPKWTMRDWFPILLDLLIDYPLRLPAIRELVTQEDGKLMHHNPAELQLVAWMISGIGWLQQGFHKRLQQQSWRLEQRQRIRAISLAGSILPSGVNHRMLIPLLQLSL
jgi:ribonuclease HI